MSEITKDNFVWRTKDKETPLEEMDTQFKIIALIHCLKHMDINHKKHEALIKKSEKITFDIEEEAKELNEKIRLFKEKRKTDVERINKSKERAKKSHYEMEKFSNLVDILKQSISEDGYNVPEEIQDLWAFKRMIDKDLIPKNT